MLICFYLGVFTNSNNCQKIKLLKLYEILKHESDENNPISTSSLISMLNKLGISCDRSTLYKDIELLNENNYEIMSTRIGKSKAYYVEDRNFSVPELKILIDAVQAASFITTKKSSELIRKLSDLGGSLYSDFLSTNLVKFTLENIAMNQYTIMLDS